ncbi:hypothetical protein PIB30_101230 [Stylosanthes scabra]|uniref:Uncharacterized protein n=1 Tax=Stylosanthes scabra TaxID=79078 RepID=A0ABU6RY55_9FABA|nr:hypothetical protein [Stylosanthes scabra]
MTPTEKAMIDASSGGALMNKTPEEAWELIETVVDAKQHFNPRATSKGVYEVSPSNSTVLAKSLVDIASMLKEIREGQQVLFLTLNALLQGGSLEWVFNRQSRTSWLKLSSIKVLLRSTYPSLSLNNCTTSI